MERTPASLAEPRSEQGMVQVGLLDIRNYVDAEDKITLSLRERVAL